ncbi:MAG TPA: hypothetical protein VGF67_27905 [Ktedonobacteraceae bacterium]|jgi:hypothetical protein
MGQYQQWLCAQEVDRHLRAERETLETELLYLQDRITIMEQAVPEAENSILQALEAHFQAQARAEREQARETQRIHPPAAREGAADLQAFFDDQRHTDPTLTAWTPQGESGESGHVVDAETRRLNENIRRWFIRWRRQPVASERPEGVQNE